MGFEQAFRAGSIPILVRALRKAPRLSSDRRDRSGRELGPCGVPCSRSGALRVLTTALRSKFPTGNIGEAVRQRVACGSRISRSSRVPSRCRHAIRSWASCRCPPSPPHDGAGTRPARRENAREQLIETGWDAPILARIVELIDERARSLLDLTAAKASPRHDPQDRHRRPPSTAAGRWRCSWRSVLRVGQGSPCHDFGGALRVTDGQSREPRQRPPKAGPKARP